MKNKNMLGDTIYKLRKEKGLSQSELGKLVGVSNKAVSKWETYEANPDISLLPLLAEVFGITTDELLSEIKIEKDSKSDGEVAKIGIFKGKKTNTPEKYEFISDKKTKNGTPYLHIHIGKTISNLNAKAHGVIAIGNNAKGIFAFGFISKGIISFGLLSIGLLSFGLLALGLIGAFASIAIGAAAFGGIAAGFIAFGGIAAGYIAFGGIAIGYHAYTGIDGIAIGKYIHIIKNIRHTH